MVYGIGEGFLVQFDRLRRISFVQSFPACKEQCIYIDVVEIRNAFASREVAVAEKVQYIIILSGESAGFDLCSQRIIAFECSLMVISKNLKTFLGRCSKRLQHLILLFQIQGFVRCNRHGFCVTAGGLGIIFLVQPVVPAQITPRKVHGRVQTDSCLPLGCSGILLLVVEQASPPVPRLCAIREQRCCHFQDRQ